MLNLFALQLVLYIIFGRDFSLSDKWESERQRERGQVRWGVL